MACSLVNLAAGSDAGGGLADQAAIGVLTRTFPVELVDRVIGQYWVREQRTRARSSGVLFHPGLVPVTAGVVSVRDEDPHVRVRSWGAGLSGANDRSIGDARRRLGSGPMDSAVRAVMPPRARPETRGTWYRDWLLTAVDGSTFPVSDTENNEREFGRPVASRGRQQRGQLVLRNVLGRLMARTSRVLIGPNCRRVGADDPLRALVQVTPSA